MTLPVRLMPWMMFADIAVIHTYLQIYGTQLKKDPIGQSMLMMPFFGQPQIRKTLRWSNVAIEHPPLTSLIFPLFHHWLR